jgi:MFS family permease
MRDGHVIGGDSHLQVLRVRLGLYSSLPDWPSPDKLMRHRALFGSALLSNSTGTVVDVADEHRRALYVSLWSIAPLNGPVAGPLIGGFVYEYLGWRWDNWLVMILGGAALLLLLTVKETYGPTILRQKAARMRKETGDSRWWCRHDQQMSKMRCLGKNLSRPLVLSFTEPILWFFNIWLADNHSV